MSMEPRPLVSVVIPVWNGAERIGATLKALRGQSEATDRFEIIVVDNGSTDRTVEIVRGFPEVRLLHEPQPGSYRARNRGVAQARAEHLLFTDGDCVPAPDWVSSALEAIAEFAQSGLIGGRITLFKEEGCGETAHQYEQLMSFNQEKNIGNGFAVTANCIIPRHVLEEVGGFDDTLLSGGDVDLSRRIRERGYDLAYAAGMTVAHPSRASLGELVSKKRRVIGGRFKLENVSRRELPYWLKRLVRETRSDLKRMRNEALARRTKARLTIYFLILLAVAQMEMAALVFGKASYRS